jgi:hypothetical protein
MRMQIIIREDLAQILNELAWQEKRWPKQQAEWLLQQELERRALARRVEMQQGDAYAEQH